MMEKKQKNYLIYLIILVLFGGLIYAAIRGGSHLFQVSASEVASGENAFEMFTSILQDNLNHPLSILLLQIIIVLFVVRVFTILFKWLRQPGVIGEIVAGIVIGPSVLGALYPEFFGFIFRPESLTNLELISQLGLVLFMFVIGMEVDFGTLKSRLNKTIVISHTGILLSFFLGIIASFWIYEEYASHQTPFLPFSLFIGISMSITAFPVLARIIQERNMTRKPIGILTIASAANDDVTAWCLLAVVIAITKAGTLGGAMYTILLTLAYIVIMFAVVRPFLKKIGDVYSNKEVINKTFVGFIFLILTISSAITEALGIHALFGAFMAGVIMPSNFGFRKVMMEKVEDVALVFFLPLFFAFTGLRTQIGLINTPELWGVCLMLIAVAFFGKLGGCSIAARLVGENWKDSLTVGTLMTTRGLMELVALNIGYELGILPPSIFVILIIMALVTTFTTTPMLNLLEWVFKKREQKTTLQRKLMLFFGRPDSAAQFMEESFIPVEKEAKQLRVNIDKRYKVTDNLVPDMISTVKTEAPDILLLGAGPRFMMDGEKSMTAFFGLFRKKVDDVIRHVSCPVAVFVNRDYHESEELSLLINGEPDSFLLTYLNRLLESGDKVVHLHYLDSPDSQMVVQILAVQQEYPSKTVLHPLQRLEDIALPPDDSLLVLSYDTCAKIATHEAAYKALPSLVVIKNKVMF